MATSRKRLHGLSIVGFVFMLTAGTWLAMGQPAVAAGMFIVGLALFCAGVAAARKAMPPAGGTATALPADGGGGGGGQPSDANDGTRV